MAELAFGEEIASGVELLGGFGVEVEETWVGKDGRFDAGLVGGVVGVVLLDEGRVGLRDEPVVEGLGKHFVKLIYGTFYYGKCRC